jgi:DNA-binding NtrC family response regulator
VARAVLLLEDDVDQLEIIALAIGTFCGRDCVLARSYLELTQLGDVALDTEVALLDINLGPGIENGLDAYRWLRGRGFQGRIYFLTGHARAHPQVAEALAVADAGVIEKPLAMEGLCEVIEDATRPGAAR